jgi:hypothetical protein
MSETIMESLGESMFKELERAREILKMYEEIPQGAFGAAMIRQTIKAAERSIIENNVVEMLVTYQQLKEIQ